MFKDNVEWFFPDTVEKAWDIINDKNKNNIIYSGGLGVNRLKSEKIDGFVNFKNLDLGYIKHEDDNIYLGAGCIISDIIQEDSIESKVMDIIKSAFSMCAATPIKNRMTLGGSVVDFPIWSDIVPVLQMLNSKVKLYNGEYATLSISEYHNKKEGIVCEIIIPEIKSDFNWFKKRLTQVRFDYPALTVNMIYNFDSKKINNPVIYVSGTKNKSERLKDLEKRLEGLDNKESIFSEIEKIDLDFSKDHRYSSEYKNRMTKVYLKEGIMERMEDKG